MKVFRSRKKGKKTERKNYQFVIISGHILSKFIYFLNENQNLFIRSLS